MDFSWICQQIWREHKQSSQIKKFIIYLSIIFICSFRANTHLCLSNFSFFGCNPSFCSKFQPLLPNSAAYFFATGGGYDKLEVYKCSDSVKTPAVTREMVIRFPSRMVSWRHEEFHMVIQMLRLNTHVHKHTHARMHIHINTHRHTLFPPRCSKFTKSSHFASQ